MTKFRSMILGGALLLLAGCGSEEYPMPAAQAVSTLASLGYSPALSTMPTALGNVQVSFESMPDGKSVQWSFKRGRDDLGRIVAMVEPSGEAASKVKVDYVEGSDRGGGTAGRIRKQLQITLKPLFVEAVDSALDGRAFDQAVRAEVDANLTKGLGQSTFSGVDASLDAEVERRREREPNGPSRRFDGSRQSSPSQSPTGPTSDLSRFSN